MEPQPLSSALADYVARAPEGSRRQRIGRQLLQAHEANQQRRAAVLRHPELAAELTRPPLGFARPEHWNGYIPPALAMDDTGEVLRQVMQTGRVYLNQAGRRSCGMVWNETPQRAVLLALSAAAWELEHADGD